MRAKKSNLGVYLSLQENSVSRPTNITDLLKKNKAEQKKEKIAKIYTIVGLVSLVLAFGIFFLS